MEFYVAEIRLRFTRATQSQAVKFDLTPQNGTRQQFTITSNTATIDLWIGHEYRPCQLLPTGSDRLELLQASLDCILTPRKF